MPLENPSGYNMYLFNLLIANHILIIKSYLNKNIKTKQPLPGMIYDNIPLFWVAVDHLCPVDPCDPPPHQTQ